MSIGLHFFKALALKVLSPSYFLMESIDLTTAKTLDIIPEKSFELLVLLFCICEFPQPKCPKFNYFPSSQVSYLSE